MKILIVTQCFYPDIYNINDIVRIMVERGHQVTVLTGLPDYTTSTVPPKYKWFKNRHENYFGADVYRVSIIARHHGAIFRCLNYLSFVLMGWLYASFKSFKGFDLIYVWQVSPVTMAVPAIKLRKKHKIPLYLYCLDLWPESIKAMGFKEHSLIFKIIRWWSKRIYRQCDHIAVTSMPFINYLSEYIGYEKNKISYIPQFASTDFLNLDLRKEKNGHFDFLFIGNIGKVQDVDIIIKAFNKIKDNNKWTMHIVGNGSNYEQCVSLVDEYSLKDRIIFYGSCPLKDTPKYYKKADACILTLNGDNLIGSTLPGKLQTYMAAGKTIIAAINGAGQQIIRDSECGACVNAGDIDGLASKLLDFIENNESYVLCGDNSRKYFVDNFTEEKFFNKFENELYELIGEK